MAIGYKDLLEAANQQVRSVDVKEARELEARDDVVFVDIRDVRELDREGKIEGSQHAPRGMLEFWIDPESPYHKPYFAEDKLFVFYCASGWRSLLAAQLAQDMGLKSASLKGGYSAWKDDEPDT